jgi:glyoxylase-like metal-dependent hydrolase (beta-lactamase superfamily II)
MTKPLQVAAGIFRLSAFGSNVYFVRSGSSWVLIDAAWANCGLRIQRAAEGLFGVGSRPQGIVLTHVHPDHAGSALELARIWGCPVYVPVDELPLAVAKDLATVEQYANPLDHRIVLPILRALGPRRVASMLTRNSLENFGRAFDPRSGVPCLSDWTCVATPGHSPGHVAFYRASDRVLLSGDAVLTVDVNSLWGWLAWARHNRPQVFGAPHYTNWDQTTTDESVRLLAALEPRVLATGHGAPMAGDAIAADLHSFADQLPSCRVGGSLRPGRERAIVVIKVVHSAIFLVNCVSVVHVFWVGLTGRRSRWTGLALLAALTESAVFVTNRGRCPLTSLVEHLGSASGRVSDIFLPRWFADRIPCIFGPLLVVGLLAMVLRELHDHVPTVASLNRPSFRKRENRRRWPAV